MTGEAIMDFGRGWACTNEANLFVEKDIVKIGDEMFSKQTETLRFMALFSVVDKVAVGDEVWVVFKIENQKVGFHGRIKGIGGDLTIMDILGRFDNVNDTINKIKNGQYT